MTSNHLRPVGEPRMRSFLLAWCNCGWRWLWTAWRFLRQATGDDAYDRYLRHTASAHPGQAPMTRSEYFRLRQEQKWNRISRCC